VSGEEPIVVGMAGRYATALFELARDASQLPTVEADLNTLKAMLDHSEDLRLLVRNPVFSNEQQLKALRAIMTKAELSDLTQNFVGVVIGNRRLFALSDMIVAFKGLMSKHRGEIQASVTSAKALQNHQIEDLKAALKSAVGRDVQMTTEVDEELLGGIVVKVGSRMIDTSLATKINNIQIAMKEA